MIMPVIIDRCLELVGQEQSVQLLQNVWGFFLNREDASRPQTYLAIHLQPSSLIWWKPWNTDMGILWALEKRWCRVSGMKLGKRGCKLIANHLLITFLDHLCNLIILPEKYTLKSSYLAGVHIKCSYDTKTVMLKIK